MGMNDINSLSHTKWNCKYHIVFAPKYRRKVFYNEKRIAKRGLRPHMNIHRLGRWMFNGVWKPGNPGILRHGRDPCPAQPMGSKSAAPCLHSGQMKSSGSSSPS